MSHSRKIITFGISGIAEIKYEDGTISFEGRKSAIHLANYNIVIYTSGVFEHKYRQSMMGRGTLEPNPPEAIQRENELRSALERGQIVCIIGSDCEDYVTSGILHWLDIPFIQSTEGAILRGFETKRSEFKSFLDDVGATSVCFGGASIDDVICAQGTIILGFSKNVRRGLLVFIPCIWGSHNIDYLVKHLKMLISGLISYSARVDSTPPSYADEFQFNNEKNAKNRIEQIKKEEIVPLEQKLARYVGMKSILWKRDSNLVNALVTFFNNLGFTIEVDEKYEEDFWITNKNGTKQVIVEVKGLNNNLTRQDIAKLDEHREARQVPDLTGLLIANTFVTADSLSNKDIPFPPNVIEKAINSNIVITRTLDLCRIFDWLENPGSDSMFILEKSLVGQKGWLTIHNGKIEILSH